ncbi:MAG: HAMP domain-containing histidine kinase [Desulfamplus sp.]|nr:HAMP domain-containing histidine kinase [Desulfamplus sp.]
MDNIKEGVNRTQEIVLSLRLYSRMDDFDFKQIDIHSLIGSALVILKTRYYNQIDVIKEYGITPKIYGHPGKLIQVFTNIIANAIDALQTSSGQSSCGQTSSEQTSCGKTSSEQTSSEQTSSEQTSSEQSSCGKISSGQSFCKQSSERKRIVITTSVLSREGMEYIEVAIQDNGPGIAAEHLDKIFDPFFTTKDVGKGSGLGLSISIGIIKEHNGIVEVTSRPKSGIMNSEIAYLKTNDLGTTNAGTTESGTTFSVLLPIKEEK